MIIQLLLSLLLLLLLLLYKIIWAEISAIQYINKKILKAGLQLLFQTGTSYFMIRRGKQWVQQLKRNPKVGILCDFIKLILISRIEAIEFEHVVGAQEAILNPAFGMPSFTIQNHTCYSDTEREISPISKYKCRSRRSWFMWRSCSRQRQTSCSS